MVAKYVGFSDRADMIRNFEHGYGREVDPERAATYPTEEQILYASYDAPPYEGDAFVIFERDGKLYEVHGSHSSCHGLEGQWEPEETSWNAIAMRKSYWSSAHETDFFKALVARNIESAAQKGKG